MKPWEANIRKVVPYTPGEQPNESGMIKLNTNENPYSPAPGVEKALKALDTDTLRLYPDPTAGDLVHSIAAFYGLKDEQVFTGVGSDDVLAMCFLTFFNSEKPILFPDITYSFYDVWADLFRIPYERPALDEEFHIRKEDYFRENGGIVFPNPNAPTGVEMPLSEIEEIVAKNPESIVIVDEAYVDFGVWGLCLGDLNKDQLKPLAEEGVVAFKFFWGYAIDSKTYQLIYNYEEGMKDVIPPFSTGEVYKLFRDVAETGKKIAIHAEDFGIIKVLTEEAKDKGMNDYDGMLYSRPDFSETIVIDTAIKIAEATGADLHILHLAAGDGVEIIKSAQKKGSSVTVETCPHYLALTNEDYDHAGNSMKGYPPVRTKRDMELLWGGLNDGTIAFVATLLTRRKKRRRTYGRLLREW